MKNKGVWYAIGAYFLWGMLPVYWKLIKSVPPVQILAHRIVWSFVFVLMLIFIFKDWEKFRAAIGHWKTLLIYTLTAIIIGINWGTYIWAVNSNHVLESSLGYFINPLVSVLFGVVFLREKLRAWQTVPVMLAVGGVVYLTVQYGQLPWIAIVLAVSFGLYGLLKKIAPLNALHGLTLETAILFLPCVGYLILMDTQGSGAFLHSSLLINILLLLTGIITALPLLLFSAAARSIPLSLLGIIQYLSPSIQFVMGIFLFHEEFTVPKLIGFIIIWVAVALFSVEGVFYRRKVTRLAV